MIRLFKFFIAAVILPVLLNCGINTADGGGVIVNNPCISGSVRFPAGQYAFGAMAVIGYQGGSGSIDTTIGVQHGDFFFYYNIKFLDTAYCDIRGKFSFNDVFPRNYVLVAQSKETGMFALTNISVNYNESVNVDLTLEAAAELIIKPYSYNRGDSSNFVAAQIAGTGFVANVDENTGLLKFDQVPAGELEIVLFRKNNSKEKFSPINTVSSSKSTLLVDPHRSYSHWTAIVPGPRDPKGNPYILSSNPPDEATGEFANQISHPYYDVEIQFSHPMDSKLTNPAISVKSSDSLTSLDSIWWQGGNVAYLKLCTATGSGQCAGRDSLYRSGTTYSIIIDTTASTSVGVRFQYPDTITFVPKP